LSSPSVREFGYHSFIFATWIPVVILFNDYVAELTTINGPSMYPFLNPDMNSTTRRDSVVNWKWDAQRGLARGMVVTFWWVGLYLYIYSADLVTNALGLIKEPI
jgi:signal peptidase I